MAGYCKIILIGNLGRDPESRCLPDSTVVTNFSLAVTEKVKGEDKTQWYRVTAFGKLGDICAKYLRKGKQVFVDGRLQTSEWQGKDGQTKYTLEVIANTMQMLGAAGNGSGGEYSKRSQPSKYVDANDGEDIPF